MSGKASYNFIVDNVQSRTEEWEGRKYTVVPVVAMVEGVHHGSGGAMFYPADEIAKFAEAWNGRPLPVFHPTDLSGRPISCNDPGVIAERSVGHTFNFEYQDGKLKGEAWIDIEKAQEIAPEILSMIMAHDNLEVSTGLFSDVEQMSGEWNGETYDGIMRNFRPDHLALLPGGTGACSWSDGCGVRANQKGENIMPDEIQIHQLDKRMVIDHFFTMDTSYEEVRNALQLKVDGMDNNNWIHYVKAVYDDYFVYSAQPTSPSVNSGPKLWKQKYVIDENREVEFKDDPVEVVEKTSYEPVNNVNANSSKGGTKMPNKKCCEEKVQLLIENEASPFTENHREWLEGLNEQEIDAFMPKEREKSPVEIVVEETARKIEAGELPQQTVLSVNSDGGLDVVETEGDPEPDTVEDYIANAPAEMQEAMRAGLALVKEKKDKAVETIMANKANKFSKEQLEAMDNEQLENMALLSAESTKTNDFSLGGGSQPQTNEIEVLEAPTFDDYTPKTD